ncbi:MAG: septal ring lytic transglycosylase RlpA family protein [Bacteroidetes bacterium]|nr:septal ring lytic transglycosylase RlpA family protein [Bacteroidota bacterium]
MKFFYLLILFACFINGSSQIDSAKTETGTASFYAKKFEGRKCSSGLRFHHDSLTAAHKMLKFGTKVKVTNLKNDSVVFVTINDRLPKNSRRKIDLTLRAAKQLNFVRSGLTKVRIEVLKDSIPLAPFNNGE